MTIVVAGGSGFIGTMLTKRLLGQGHTVIVVATHSPLFTHQNLFFIQVDAANNPLPYNILEQTDAVINLIGAPINKKWTEFYKQTIRDSRVKSTECIVAGIAAAQNRPTVFISASATGFYGNTGEEVVDEQTLNGSGFLASVCAEWETAARKATEYGVRVVCIRTAPVIGQGGMLAELKRIASFGFIPRLTKENPWFSWISDLDVVNAYLFALETSTLQGVVNASAPEPIRYNDFLQTLKNNWKHRLIVTMPSWAAKKLFGEGYEELTDSSRVVPKRLLDKGFQFVYPTIESAIKPHETN
ncbi:MAG: cell division inhibitor [Candidatus Nomurabacteria bacterium]|nr:cell division inhibitor [Candidatus Nomurabacteria bacterium]